MCKASFAEGDFWLTEFCLFICIPWDHTVPDDQEWDQMHTSSKKFLLVSSFKAFLKEILLESC